MASYFWPQNLLERNKWLRNFSNACDHILFGLWVTCFVLLLTAGVCENRPVALQLKSSMSGSAISAAVDFLTKYGYLEKSSDASNLRSEDQLKEAIKAMQLFANIAPTGVMDEETMGLMKRKRCGVPDILSKNELRKNKRYVLQGQKWHTTNLTWSVKEPDGENTTMVRSQLRRAFTVWSEASALSFVESFARDADIVISFPRGSHGDGFPFDGVGAVLAHAFFPGDGIGGDAHFDAEELWLPHRHPALERDEGVNLFAVAAHEIGHSLGLSHSSTPGSLMFPYYQVMDEHFKLPEDDTHGIQYLYGPKYFIQRTTTTTVIPTRYLFTSNVTVDSQKGTVANTEVHTSTFITEASITEKEIIGEDEENTQLLDPPPDACNASIDAISVIRREVFIFKDQYFWRLNVNKTLKRGYPVPIDRFWYNIPRSIKRIDAVYQRPTDNKIIFFSGKKYWLFAGNQLDPGYPHPITNLGLPSYVESIDAAMVWGHNGKTYLFSGSRYWKLDEDDGTVELDYPRDISAWRGIPRQIDAAFQWNDENTYFFKEKKFWKFNDHKMKAYNIPGDISEFWFGCSTEKEVSTTHPTTFETETYEHPKSDANTVYYNLLLLLFMVILTINHHKIYAQRNKNIKINI